MDEQHLILIKMLVDGDLRAGQERFGACGKRRAGCAWIDRNDHLAGGRGAKL
jgi:hypothetical protein